MDERKWPRSISGHVSVLAARKQPFDIGPSFGRDLPQRPRRAFVSRLLGEDAAALDPRHHVIEDIWIHPQTWLLTQPKQGILRSSVGSGI